MDQADNPVDRLLAQGQGYYNAERYEEALSVFKQLIEVAPVSSEAHLNLGNTCFKLEEYALAETHWLKAIDLDPLESSAYLNLGNLYLKRSNPQAAVRYWQMFRKLNKTHSTVCLNLGIAYDQLADPEKAFESYSSFLGLSPSSPEAARLHARFDTARKAFGNNMIIAEKALGAGQLDKAREVYEKTLPMYPGSARIYKAYAMVLYKLKDYDNALVYYLKTYKHDPDDPTVLINMGVIYEKLGRPVDALWAYGLARRHRGDDQTRVAERYETLLEQHRGKMAIAFEEACALIPQGRLEEAGRRLKRLSELARELPEAAVLNPKIIDALERIEEAQDPLLKAAKTFYNRGIDAQEAGRYDQALRFLGRYLQLYPNGGKAAEVRERLDVMRKTMGAVVQSLLDSEEETP